MFGLSLVKKNPATGHYELSPGTEVIAQFPDTDDSAPNPLKMHATALAIDSQGRVIQGGRAIQDVSSGIQKNYFAVCRYLPDGTLDTSFGEGGRVLYDFNGALRLRLEALVADPADNIIAVGSALTSSLDKSDANVALICFNAKSGEPDQRFGDPARLNSDYSSPYGYQGKECAEAIAIDKTNGLVLIAGSENKWLFWSDGTTNFREVKRVQFVVRYLKDGSRDEDFSFDYGLPVESGCGGQYAKVHSLAVDNLGRVLLGGGMDGYGVLSWSYTNSEKKLQFIDTPEYSRPHGITDFKVVCFDKADRVMAAGIGEMKGSPQFVIMRFHPIADAQVLTADPSFGDKGVACTVFDAATAIDINGMLIEPNGKIIVAGLLTINGRPRLALAFYDEDGNPDAALGDKNGLLVGGDYISLTGFNVTSVCGLARKEDGTLVVGLDGYQAALLGSYAKIQVIAAKALALGIVIFLISILLYQWILKDWFPGPGVS